MLSRGLLLSFCLPLAALAARPVDFVEPRIDTHQTRWIFFASASRPFGMVALSPDTKLDGDWGAGYIYVEPYIRAFSHIHDWQLAGVPVLPVVGRMNGHEGYEAYKAPFSHDKEVVHPGYHKVVLDNSGITAELTSTKRVGFHRYSFPATQDAYILLDVGAPIAMTKMAGASLRKTGPRQLAGFSKMAPTQRREKPCTVYFVIDLDRDIAEFGGWENGPAGKTVRAGIDRVSGAGSGGYVRFRFDQPAQVRMKVALSYVSEENARRNLEAELPGWDFDATVRASSEEWNQWLSKIQVSGGTRQQQVKFYTDLWHALLGRRTFSDADGRYVDNTGAEPRIRQVPHDIAGLIQAIGGPQKFLDKLNRQFEQAAPKRYVTPHGRHAEEWVDYENQPSCHMAHLFSHAGAPWLTQYWVRRVKEESYGAITPFGGYNGDEDQGQMGGIGVLMAMGLFDVTGGAGAEPRYELTSPLFRRIAITLDPRYYPGRTFTITTRGNGTGNVYIQSAALNGKPLTGRFWITHRELTAGGTLEITLGARPNRQWGLPPAR